MPTRRAGDVLEIFVLALGGGAGLALAGEPGLTAGGGPGRAHGASSGAAQVLAAFRSARVLAPFPRRGGEDGARWQRIIRAHERTLAVLEGRARDERAAVAMTERLGATRSPLTVEELLEALRDPRFPVRFEAIVSIARRGPDPRLTEALVETLEGSEPALSTVAAWALGRIGDESALEALRRGLEARYRSVQAHCARSLGNLGDQTVQDRLLARLEGEEDPGLQLAYAAALGQLGAAAAAGRLLALLDTAEDADARGEFALALARLAGDERGFIQLQRRTASEPGTALSQAVTAFKGKLARSPYNDAEVEAELEAAAGALARDDLAAGTDLLVRALVRLQAGPLAAPCDLVLGECIAQLEASGPARPEYVVLALHAATCGVGEVGW